MIYALLAGQAAVQNDNVMLYTYQAGEHDKARRSRGPARKGGEELLPERNLGTNLTEIICMPVFDKHRARSWRCALEKISQGREISQLYVRQPETGGNLGVHPQRAADRRERGQRSAREHG